MKFLAYGLFGEQLTSSLDADNYATLPFFLIIVGLTIGAVWLISHLRKQHKYMSFMIVFTVYILLIGFACAIAMGVVWLIIKWLASLSDAPPPKPVSSKESAADRKAALDSFVMLGYDLEDYLNPSAQEEFKNDFANVLYDENSTADDIYFAMRRWEIYRNNPMTDSKEWKERNNR